MKDQRNRTGMMNMKWKQAVPLLAIAAIAAGGAAGCVPQPASFAAGEVVSAQASSVPSSELSADPARKSEVSSLSASSPSEQTANPTNTGTAKKAPMRPVAKPPASETKTPKSWPKESRRGSEKEKSATGDFVEKTQQMTSPGFSRKAESPDKPLPASPDYRGVAAGVALGELEAQFMEYANNNWKQTGGVVVLGEPKVEDLTVGGVETHRVYVCLDSSAMQVTEQDGFVVTPKVAAATRTALNVYDLQEREGQLVVVNHLFPEDPNC